jgi:hypothetical protein
MPNLNLEDLGAVASTGNPEHDLAHWRATFLGGTMTSSTSLLFEEEPEHRAIEELMFRLGATSARILPPTFEPAESAYDAGERLLAIARGLPQDKANDPEGLADLLSAAVAYAAAVHEEATS